MRILLLPKKTLYCIILLVFIIAGIRWIRLPVLESTSARHPKVAIVIDDFGGYAAGIKEMMALPFPLTFAVMPFAEFSCQQGEEAAARGFEVIVHMPFEAVRADVSWYGRKYISSNLPEREIRGIIDEAFQVLPKAAGMNNHMGSKATADPRVMKIVLEEVSRLNRFYFDSKTAESSPAAKLTADLGMPWIARDLFLDENGSPERIRRQLDQLMSIAKKKGLAIGIGHVGPTGPILAEILREEIPHYQKEGFCFVKLSEITGMKPMIKTLKSKKGLIGIDPGHGGIDSGTWRQDIREKDINLKFSRELAAELRLNGYRSILTRKDDRLLSPFSHYRYRNRPYKRDDIERRLKKLESAGSDLILSIHVNWHHSAFHRGPIVYYSEASPDSKCLAECVQQSLNLVQPYRKIIKLSKCLLLRDSNRPAILIELGFLSNDQDCMSLCNKAYRKTLMTAIVRGLEEYYRQRPAKKANHVTDLTDRGNER